MAAEAPMDVLGIDHVDLTVNDLARSIPFYEKVLGALGFRRVPHATYVAWANAHLAIVLRPAERNAVFDRYRVGLHHLALRADTCSFCRRHGARTTSDPSGHVAITVHHPDQLLRYRFGLRTADFLVCTRCGIYVKGTVAQKGGEPQLMT